MSLQLTFANCGAARVAKVAGSTPQALQTAVAGLIKAQIAGLALALARRVGVCASRATKASCETGGVGKGALFAGLASVLARIGLHCALGTSLAGRLAGLVLVSTGEATNARCLARGILVGAGQARCAAILLNISVEGAGGTGFGR